MGKAARVKAARRAASAPPLATGRTLLASATAVWVATGAVVVLIAIAVSVLLVTRSPGKAPPRATPSAADRNAPAALVRAADGVHFHPNVEPGVGVIESGPASAARPQTNPALLPVGSQAPAFTLKAPTGETFSLG